ncbi:MAG: flagellin lysine-N-methylase, partial [Erysipelotrichales bacterium]
MNILEPIYYDEFKCLADKCNESCCYGWRVDIDKNTFKKYKKIKGELGRKINKSISRQRKEDNELKYGKIKLNDKGMCPLVEESGLCGIHANLGESYLCNTCKIYPRTISKVGKIGERKLSLSCPAVAEFLIEYKEKIGFIFKEEDITKIEQEYVVDRVFDTKLYDNVFAVRSFLIEVAQFREIDVWKRLSFIKLVNDKLSNEIKELEIEDIDEKIENLEMVITSQDTINNLNYVKRNDKIKNLFIECIISQRVDEGITSQPFVDILNEYRSFKLKYNNNHVKVFNALFDIEIEFDNYFDSKQYILENKLVYNISGEYMNALYSRDTDKEVA